MSTATYHLMAMCPECGQVQSTGITLGPQSNASMAGKVTGCTSCGDLFEIPDGDYGVIDGAVQWLRSFTAPESRRTLASALVDARSALLAGASPAAAGEIIEARTGHGLWGFLKTEDGKALLAIIALLIALLAYLGPEPSWKADNEPPQQPPVHQHTEIHIDDRDHINIVLPARPAEKPKH